MAHFFARSVPILPILLCGSFVMAQVRVANRTIRLKTVDDVTYYSPDQWKTLRKVDAPATPSLAKISAPASLPQRIPDNLIWQQAYEGLTTVGDSSYTIPKTLLTLATGSYFLSSEGINSTYRFLQIDADGNPEWSVYKEDINQKGFEFITCSEEGADNLSCVGWRGTGVLYGDGGYIYSVNFDSQGKETGSYYNHSAEGYIRSNAFHGLTTIPSGYASCGWIWPSSLDTQHFILNYVRTNAALARIVDTTYDLWDNTTLVAQSAIAAIDGSALFCIGRTRSSVPQSTISDIVLANIDTNGSILWTKLHGGPNELLQPRSMLRCSDGGYMIAGSIFIREPEGNAIFLLKVDHQGNRQWIQTYRAGFNTVATSIAQTKDGGYILGGQTGDYSRSHPLSWTKDMYVVKVNASGEKLWDRTWGIDSMEDAIEKIIEDRDGNIVTAGYIGAVTDVLPSNAKLYVAKLQELPLSVNALVVPPSGKPRVYPNPAKQTVHIWLPENISGNIEIVNTLGVVVAKLSNGSSRLTIDVNHFSKGTYFVRSGNFAPVSFVVE